MTRSPSSRRTFLRTALAGVAAGLAGCHEYLEPLHPRDDGSQPEDGGLPVGLDPVATVAERPMGLAIPPSGGYPRYVVELPGVVRVLDSDGLRREPFLDVRDTVVTGPEQGLLGMALHPDFATNRRLFVRYSAPPRNGTPEGFDHTFVLAEFRATDDGLQAERESERTLLEIPQPQATHNAGDLAFGPDGYLYVPVGDGGGDGDDDVPGHAKDWYARLSNSGNGQNVSANLLGSVLRIDVDGRAGGKPYAVPDDNPLVGEAGLDEHYAWGFRNPWRMSFDDGDLFVGDVGQERYEEVDLVVEGGNYGWNVMEGRHCYRADVCPNHTPESVRGGEPLRDPVIEYPLADRSNVPVSGSAVVCGYLYRGSAIPGLAGKFVFADWRAGGQLFAATPRYDGLWPTEVVSVTPSDRDKLQRVFAMERDSEGELYVLSERTDATGQVSRIRPGT